MSVAGGDPARMGKAPSGRAGVRVPPSNLSVPTSAAALALSRGGAPSPAPLSATTPNSADDQTQHQALKKFFDDLINKRNRTDDKAAAAKSPDGDAGAEEGS